MGNVTQQARRAAKAEYRERKQGWAIVAVKIGGQVWVTLSPNPQALENRLGFMLRQGAGPVAAMNEAYKEAGAVELELLKKLDEELSPLARERVGKEKLAYWAERLGAAVF
jgi:hypothetical protein